MIAITKILVPVDFSEYSDYALEHALALGKALGAELHLVHVLEPIENTPAEWVFIPMDELVSKARHAAEEKFRRLAVDLIEKGFTIHSAVLTGHPDIVIAKYAEDNGISMISMGTHGRRGLEYLMFGSTTERVLKTAPCSVLAVRLPRKKETA
jgi:nucleotide-binding universal stress UspA family protein